MTGISGRVGAAVYNLGHAYVLPAAMSLVGAAGHQHTHLGGPRPRETEGAR